MESAAIVYRYGSATDDALTPRPGKDTSAPQGQRPGFSVWERISSDADKAQKIEVARLAVHGLAYLADDPSSGLVGHGVIAPVTESGDVDLAALEDWASWRRSGK